MHLWGSGCAVKRCRRLPAQHPIVPGTLVHVLVMNAATQLYQTDVYQPWPAR